MSANPIYHLKDAYFFEVPKSLWRYDWKSLSEVPSFLTDGHPAVTDVNEFNRALDGKVLIPQPFAELHSLYAPKSGFAISKYMILELVVAAVMVLIFTRVAKQLSSGEAP
jgi:F-type H+-transporting ATPase subunit a